MLGVGLWLLPGDREIVTARQRAQPVVAMQIPAPIPARAVRPAPAAVAQRPDVAAAVRTAGAGSLAALTARLIGEGQAVTTAQIAYDLVAAGRPAVALEYLAARPDGATPATWRLRFDLVRTAGRAADAAALLAVAARARSGVAAADIVAAGYALDRPDLILAAAASGAIPAPDATLALDLARRADRARRPEWIAALDRVTRADWRAADPWLALRVATQAGDTAAALRAAATLPADQRDAARDAILAKAGDRDALRASLLARARAPGAAETVAEQLLAAGHRSDAIAVLKSAATGQPTTARATQRLLYLMGPRPAADDLAWLREQTMRGSAAGQQAWLAAYVERDRPGDALAFLARHPLASRTEVLLARLALANAAGDNAAGRAVVAGLLDGRALDSAQLRTLSANTPRTLGAAQASAIMRLRVAAGEAGASDRLDLAWAAWNAGDAAKTAGWLREHLAAAPTDLVALRLMADAQTKLGGAAAARPWLERALAQTPPDSRVRAELLDRLGRRTDAVALVARLRADAPGDRALAALHARLLIAQGQPGRARAVLAQ